MSEWQRHPDDVFLSRADLGHPIFTELYLGNWIACELVRIAMLPTETYPLGAQSPYADDLPVADQLAMREQDPLGYIEKLSPPMRAAVSLAAEFHHHTTQVSQTDWMREVQLYLSSGKKLDPPTVKLRSDILCHMALKDVRHSNLTPNELRMIHLWDAYRTIVAPKPRHESDRSYPDIRIPDCSPYDQVDGDFNVFMEPDNLSGQHASYAWGYHMMSWAIFNVLGVKTDQRCAVESAWESSVWYSWGSPELLKHVESASKAHPWAEGFTLTKPDVEQADAIIHGYLRERLHACLDPLDRKRKSTGSSGQIHHHRDR